MAEISLRKINKIYNGKVHAIHDFSLEIAQNDFVVLVGPSGCGKSTILRMIAGLEEVSFGELYIDGELMNEIPPRERKIAMVFQNYALFPHMTVYENIAFGLKLAKLDREEIKARVEEAAGILGIKNLLSRKPAQLSGGQKQRVALGRAIVCKPRIFLLDEPLSNLDAKLRASMRVELIKLYNKLKTTFIYVTHDQTEALTMGTKIAVLKDGCLQQADVPSQIYDYPANQFVASFMGSPQMNLFEVDLIETEKGLAVRFQNGDMLSLPEEIAARLVDREHIGQKVVLGIRPENLFVAEEGAEAPVSAVTDYSETLGSSLILGLAVEGALNQTTALLSGRENVRAGIAVRLATDARFVHLFDHADGHSLLDAPAYNLFRGNVAMEDGMLCVSVGKNKIMLDKYDCLLNDGVLNGAEIRVGLPAAQPAREGGEGRFSLRGCVVNVFRQHSRSVVYAAIDGTAEKLVFACGLDAPYRVGETYEFFMEKEEIRLTDADGNSLLSRHPTRGRFRELSPKKLNFSKGLRILEDEFVGDGYLLYCGSAEDYCVVKVGKDYPVYFNERVKISEGSGAAQ